jgi:hypothetical protein
VKQEGLALCLVKEQTESICLEAAKQNPEAIECIRDRVMFYKVAKALAIEVE